MLLEKCVWIPSCVGQWPSKPLNVALTRSILVVHILLLPSVNRGGQDSRKTYSIIIELYSKSLIDVFNNIFIRFSGYSETSKISGTRVRPTDDPAESTSANAVCLFFLFHHADSHVHHSACFRIYTIVYEFLANTRHLYRVDHLRLGDAVRRGSKVRSPLHLLVMYSGEFHSYLLTGIELSETSKFGNIIATTSPSSWSRPLISHPNEIIYSACTLTESPVPEPLLISCPTLINSISCFRESIPI